MNIFLFTMPQINLVLIERHCENGKALGINSSKYPLGIGLSSGIFHKMILIVLISISMKKLICG